MPEGHRLLGRSAQLERLDDVLDLAHGRGGTLLVLGEPGVGKSALIAAAARRASDRGVLVLKTTGVPSESQLPFAGLHQLLLPVLHHADALPGPQRTALLAAFGRVETTVGDYFGVALAALSLLRDRGSEQPVLLVAEDLHWLDRLSADVLAFVARRVDADPIALVVSSREVPRGALADVLQDELVLEGLDDEAAAALVDEHAPDLDPALRERLLAVATGNALALVELAVAWRRLPPGTLIASWVPVSTRLKNTFTSRVETLPAPCRVALLIAALNDGDSLSEVLAAATVATAGPVTARSLEPAVAARLVEVDESGVRFRHPLMRSAIYQAADVPQRQSANAALAEVLGDADRVAWHRAAAVLEPDEDVAAALEATATRARRRGAVVVAIASLERAARLSPEAAARGRRLIQAAEFAVELGRQDVVARLLDEAEPLTLEPVDRIRAQWRRGLLADGVWRDAAQVRTLVEITDRMHQAGDVDMALEALTTVSAAGWWTSVGSQRRALVTAAAERVPAAPDDPRLLNILALAAPVERGAVVLERLRAIRLETVDEPGALGLLGTTAGIVGAQDLAATYLDLSIRRLRTQSRLAGLTEALVSRAWAAWHLGTWEIAAAVAAEARRLGEQTERPTAVAAASLVEGALAAARGDSATAERVADEVESLVRPWGATSMLSLVTFVRGLAAQADGRSEAAYDLLRPLYRPEDDGSSAWVGLAAVTVFVDAAVQCGRVDEASTIVDAFDRLARRTGSPTTAASVSYARPLVAADDDAEPQFVAALERDLLEWPFLHARLLLAYGTWLRRRRRVGESRAPLRAARDALDGLAALPWGERARQELRATGESSGARSAQVDEQLTAQEREIVRLAARGMTNREIGRQLYLSHRTVGSHLYHAFPKLGISSRSELVGAVPPQHLPVRNSSLPRGDN